MDPLEAQDLKTMLCKSQLSVCQEGQLPTYKIYILLSSIFQDRPSLFQLRFIFKSQVLCKESKVSNLNAAFEMVTAAKSSIQPEAPSRVGEKKGGEEWIKSRQI